METAKKVSIKHPVDLGKVSVQKDPFHTSAYIISLPLDSDPSYTWQTLFEAELSSSLDFWDRKVLVLGKELKLVSTQNNLEEKLRWLEQVITATNKRVEDHNKKVKAERNSKGLKDRGEAVIRSELSRWSVRRTRG